MSSTWKSFATAEEAAAACSSRILESLANARTLRGRATLAVSGGSTPKLMFGHMARSGFDWSRVHVFFVDERCVGPDHAESNFNMCRVNLLDPAGVPPANVHRMKGEFKPSLAALDYAQELDAVFGAGSLPVFDVIHRGMGADAHTASLFPGEPLIDDRTQRVGAVYVEKLDRHRITLLPAVLLAARETAVLAAGADKADPLGKVFHGPRNPRMYPSQLDTPWASWVTWYLDEPAAARLLLPG
jgi:6-phosphogluconolactonase